MKPKAPYPFRNKLWTATRAINQWKNPFTAIAVEGLQKPGISQEQRQKYQSHLKKKGITASEFHIPEMESFFIYPIDTAKWAAKITAGLWLFASLSITPILGQLISATILSSITIPLLLKRVTQDIELSLSAYYLFTQTKISLLPKLIYPIVFGILSLSSTYYLPTENSRLLYMLGFIATGTALPYLFSLRFRQILKPKTQEITKLAVHEDDFVKEHVAFALGRFYKNSPANTNDITQQMIGITLIEMLQDSEKDVRIEATLALGKKGQMIGAISEMLGDPEWRVRRAAVIALRKTKDKTAILDLMRAMHDEDSDVAQAAAKALRSFDQEDVSSVLSFKAKFMQFALLKKSVKRLEVDPRYGIDDLFELSEHHNEQIRTAAVIKLTALPSAIGSHLLFNSLIHHLERTQEKYPVGALTVLQFIKLNRRHVDKIWDMFSSKEYCERRASVLVMGEIGNQNTVEPIINALTDKQPSVRSAAAHALVRLAERGIELQFPKIMEKLEWLAEHSSSSEDRVHFRKEATDHFLIIMAGMRKTKKELQEGTLSESEPKQPKPTSLKKTTQQPPLWDQVSNFR